MRRRLYRRSKRLAAVAVKQVNPSQLINPVVLYSAIWLMALLFLWLQWATFMSGVSRRLLIFVAANIVVSLTAYTIAAMLTKRRSQGSRNIDNRASSQRLTSELPALRSYSDLLFAVWAVGSIFNVVASGGLPIVWLLEGNQDRTYADFGLWTVSGFLAACGLFATMGFLLYRMTGGARRRWWAIMLVFAYYVAVINRGAIVLMILQLLGIYLQVGRIGIRRMLGGVAILLVLIVVFGLVGDLRTGYSDTFLRSIETPHGMTALQHLPSGFWWTYLYASVGPLNLNAALDQNAPRLGYPYWSVFNLFPSVVRVLVYRVRETAYEARYPLPMVSGSFNVFTLYGGYLADFGLIGCLVITLFLQMLAGHYFVKAKSGDISSVLGYAICFQIIVASLFTDNLTSWVTLFQLALAFVFGRVGKSLWLPFSARARRASLYAY